MILSHSLRLLPRIWKRAPLPRSFRRVFSASPILHNINIPHFKHTPLLPRHIRLLRIHKYDKDSPPNTPVSATCSHVSLDSNPEYVALSYCWGDLTLTHSITLNGLAYPVTSNLHAFMNYIARSDNDYNFWIDAVSIQQTDLKERGEQVGLMGEVYSKASFVVAWLGEEGENSELAFDHVEAAAERALSSQDRSGAPGEQLHENSFVPSDEGYLPPLTFAGLRAVRALMRRPWFKRIWIIQEVMLAKSAVVVCGKRVLGWETFAFGVNGSFRPKDYLGQPIEPLIAQSGSVGHDISEYGWSLIPSVQSWRARFSAGVDLDMSSALSSFLGSQSSDPRDMVYGILGIMEKKGQMAICPDYTIAVSDLYAKAALHCIAINKSLRILSVSGIGYDRSTIGLPSWAPDYVNLRSFNFNCRWGNSGGETTVKHRSVDFRKLCLTGYQVDVVDRLGPVWDDLSSNSSVDREWYFTVEAMFLQPEINRDEFWRTLCKNRATVYDDAPVADGMLPYYEAYQMVNQMTRGLQDLSEIRQAVDSPDPDMFAKADDFFALLGAACLGKKMGATRSGRLGVFPPNTRVGDQVFVALGGHDPLLTREAQKEEDDVSENVEHLFVGSCYVHGIMDGEVLKMGLQEEEVILV